MKNKIIKQLIVSSISVFFSSTLLAESYTLDSIREQFKQNVQNEHTSRLYGHLMAFETEPDLSGSSFSQNTSGKAGGLKTGNRSKRVG